MLKLLPSKPTLLTVLVPRHPDRRDEIGHLIKQSKLKYSQRSKGEIIAPDCDIYLGDTIGEMGLYIRMAPIIFMGRSLSVFGGQNALEPAAIGAAIISGNNITNFRDVYKNLLKNNGVRLVKNAEMLRSNLSFLLKNPAECAKMIIGGKKTVDEMSGALENTIEVLDSYVFPLTIKSKLEEINKSNKK